MIIHFHSLASVSSQENVVWICECWGPFCPALAFYCLWKEIKHYCQIILLYSKEEKRNWRRVYMSHYCKYVCTFIGNHLGPSGYYCTWFSSWQWWGSGHTTPPNMGTLGILSILSWKHMRKWQKQEGHSDFPSLPFFPETVHITLRWMVISRYPEEGSILISEDKGTPRKILTTSL